MMDRKKYGNMEFFYSLLLLSLLASVEKHMAAARPQKLNDRPTIAVLAQMLPHNTTNSYIAASYVKYLESAGARVVPIPHYFTADQIKKLFPYVNGVLFPGGGSSLIAAKASPYYTNSKLLWNLAIKAYDRGVYFPLWGTCLGFQAMHVIRAKSQKEDVMSRRVSSDVALPLQYTAHAEKSKLFAPIPRELYVKIGKEKVTYNHHNSGITRETYDSTPLLKDFFKVLSTNVDVNGKEYISTVEAYKYPIYGVQWHPEKNNFEFTRNFKNIPHFYDAVRTSQYLANFFVNETRKNMQAFPTNEIEEKYMIYRHTTFHSALKSHGSISNFEQIYIF